MLRKYILAAAATALSASFASAATVSITETAGFTAGPWVDTNDAYFVGYYYTFAPTQVFLKYNLDIPELQVPVGSELVINSVSITTTTAGNLPITNDSFTIHLYSVDNDTWQDSGPNKMSWDTRPAANATAIASNQTLPAWAQGTVFSSTVDFVDYVTQELNGDGTLSLMVEATGLDDLGRPTNSSSRHAYYYSYAGANPAQSLKLLIDYDIVPVPEPTSVGLLCAGAALLTVRRRNVQS